MVITHEATPGPRARALAGLGSLIGFDAALLVRDPGDRAPCQVAGVGYDPGSARALTQDFPSLYRTGFTRRLSTADGLPLSISHGPIGVSQRFLGSGIYRDHLGPSGFLDGLTVELGLGERRIGLAHFSSRQSQRFTHEARRRVDALSGMLAVVLDDAAADQPEEDSWVVDPGAPATASPASGHPLRSDERFARHLDAVMAAASDPVEHLWLGEQRWRVRISPLGGRRWGIRADPAAGEDLVLSDQETRVLSLLCTGAEDARIAAALSLSVRTVHSHVAAVRRKLGAANRVQAAMLGITRGLHEPDPERCPIRFLLTGRAAR